MNKAVTGNDPSCMDDFDPESLSADAALARVLESVSAVSGTETLPIREALNRVLAEDVKSGIDVPAKANSAMDGYAVRAADLGPDGGTELQVIGTTLAGAPFEGELTPGAAVRIMTGAVVPDGADAVVIQERTQRDGDRVIVNDSIKAGDNVRRAGEDIRAGESVLSRGTRLMPAELGLLASLGIGEVGVTRRPRVAFFSTGDELRSIGEDLKPGEIYDSNRYTLFGMLERVGADINDMGVVRDQPDALEQAFRKAGAEADMVITSGGVSVGEADYVKAILRKVGSIHMWKVAMKPGRPLAFGRIDKAWFFGLPGNPVSVMVTFYQFVQPALRKIAGETGPTIPITIPVKCASRLKKRPGRVEYQRGILEREDGGDLVVRKTGAQGSGILSSMSHGNCFIILPQDSADVEPGAVVQVQPFFGIV